MSKTRRLISASVFILLLGALSACQSAPTGHGMSHGHHGAPASVARQGPAAGGQGGPKVLDLTALSDLDGIVPRLATKRVVFVGETHSRFDHHLNQLEVIRRLHARNPNLAIGMEFFQQPFQPHLDRFVAGELTETELLRDTEYYDRWRFDYRLYRPILAFAREHGIPVIALNVPSEISAKVGQEGLAGLADSERAQIPQDMDRSNGVYRERLREVFDRHPGSAQKDFENFLSVQLLWDEGMAERAARYLEEHPDRQLVVLAGTGHLEYGMGIPDRIRRRIPVQTAIVLNGDLGHVEPGMADYILLPEAQTLPPAGQLGAFLETSEQGVTVGSFADGSAAEAAGLKLGDRILALDGEPIARFADVKLVLWDKQPGDEVTVRVRRGRWVLGDQELTYQVGLR